MQNQILNICCRSPKGSSGSHGSHGPPLQLPPRSPDRSMASVDVARPMAPSTAPSTARFPAPSTAPLYSSLHGSLSGSLHSSLLRLASQLPSTSHSTPYSPWALVSLLYTFRFSTVFGFCRTCTPYVKHRLVHACLLVSIGAWVFFRYDPA